MHNFSIPACLKAWVDQVVRTDMTFKLTEEGVEPLVKGKKALIVTSRGGFVAGTDFDFQEPYLRKILGFIGIKLMLHALHKNTLPFINNGSYVNVPEISTAMSISVIGVVLLITTVASLLRTRGRTKTNDGVRGGT